ncbi:helix-turn-helix transcriptional regulator (plasmid) [Jeotgalibaca sp. MA1X17-3]|uniref:helix-turn-helix transcriptional regulator n=1 Tax=Jeotgalibaca sp. MA1X17-3 TaxID=2908211 RepID=UPI001F2E9B1D|nr:helix-turn-helix transcriptional regulator [Jeotgalibaca sp. MA1X17-3]UJF16765.1 helix-turn-helix transcriptional regulator [Jeotgalibaca sp. MA1X17-3]
MKLSTRQKEIIEIVKKNEPITGEKIAALLGFSRSTLRPDFSLLTLSQLLIAKPKVGYFYNTHKVEPLIIKDIKEKKVEDVMSVPVIVRSETSIQDTIIKIFLEDVGSIYITEHNHLVGLVSRKDLLKIVIGKINIEEMPISMAMTRVPNIAFVFSNDSVETATKKLLQHEVDSLPVIEFVEGEDLNYLKVVGKFSKTLISRLFLNLIKNES